MITNRDRVLAVIEAAEKPLLELEIVWRVFNKYDEHIVSGSTVSKELRNLAWVNKVVGARAMKNGVLKTYKEWKAA